LIVNNPRACRVKIDLPTVPQISEALRQLSTAHKIAMSELAKDIPNSAAQLAGTTLSALESVVKTKQHRKEPLLSADLAKIKKDSSRTIPTASSNFSRLSALSTTSTA
jgi:hypothetical protein